MVIAEEAAIEPSTNFDSEVETIVVSGTKTQKLLSNSPVAVEVIDGETIAMVAKGTLVDVLDFIPGVVVSRSQKDGYNVMMNGFDSKHVLILVDSQRLVSPTGSAVDLDQINAENIAQIEIIKGAASVMYGSNAMGGVLNIITDKTERHSATYELGSYLDNALEGDDDRTVSQLLKLSTGREVAGWYHELNLKLMQDAGFDYDPSTISQNAADLDKTFVNFASHKQFTHINADFKYQYFNEEKNRPTGTIPGQAQIAKYSSNVDQHQVDMALQNILDNWKLNARYINHQEGSGQSGSLRDAEIVQTEVNGLKSWQMGNVTPRSKSASGAEIVAGFEARYDTMNQTKRGTNSIEIDAQSRTNLSAYGQFNWITKSYQVLAGLRSQHDSDFGYHSAMRLSGMVNLGSKLKPVKLRFGIGQGYRVPDLKERFYEFDHSNLGYMVFGNENLKPEFSNNLNISLDYCTELFRGDASYNVSVSAHYDEVDDLIELGNDPEPSKEMNLDISRYINVESTTIQGFDISNQLSLDSWTIQVNYSYVEAEDQNGKRLGNRPRHQLKTNLSYDFNSIDATALVYLVYQADEAVVGGFTSSEPVVEDYTIVNFKWEQELSGPLTWHLALNNIFNEHQSSTANTFGLFDPRPVSSRELRIGASFQF